MATLEDKILGEKLQYYCSSSESENDEKDDDEEKAPAPKEVPTLSRDVTHWSGTSQNTGPKGVVQDWQLYKQLEAQKREENERQILELTKKLSMTTSTAREDEQRKKEEEIEKELEELMSDDFLLQFQKQRMAEMMRAWDQRKTFGKVLTLTSKAEFLEAVEKEDKNVTVIIHIFEKNMPACEVLNKCLDSLANDYKYVKFCKIASSTAGMSHEFKQKGLPALLVYKGNQLIGNFVRVTDELSDEFYPSDLESFLIENDMITDKNVLAY